MPGIRQHRIPLLIPLVLALAFGFLIGATRSELHAGNGASLSSDEEAHFDAFWQVWEIIQQDFVAPDGSEILPATLVDGAIRGVVEALADEHSGYLDPLQFPVMQEDWSGSIEGIGAVVQRDDDSGFLQIAWVLPGSPAEAAGLDAGDIFLEVDGVDVLDASQLELAALVRGPDGSDVQLTMKQGEETLSFTITRARIVVPNIEWRLLKDTDLGYIRLQHFNANARAGLDDALTALQAYSLPGLVLDLRGNPGGLLQSAIEISSAFIEEGPIAIQRYGERERVIQADGSFAGLAMPLVVLVDGRSASASELVAGALQDRGHATIIGEQTIGKGTMQNLYDLDNGGGLQLTIARWLTPAGRWIHVSGITPDIQVAVSADAGNGEPDAQLQAAVAHLKTLVAEIAA